MWCSVDEAIFTQFKTHSYSICPTAQFIVHVRGRGVVALQNVKDPNLWLMIQDSTLQSKVGSGLQVCDVRAFAAYTTSGLCASH